MKQLLAFATVLFFICVTASALDISEYNVTFDINPDGSVNERVSMVFENPLSEGTLNYAVLGDIDHLVVSDGSKSIDYTIEKKGDEYNVRFAAPAGTKTLVISFLAHDLVFAGDGVYSFSTDLKPPAAHNVDIRAYLPGGFAIYRDVVYPEGYEILTDGERIYLRWAMQNPGSVMLSFKFYNTHSDYSLAIMAFMALVMMVVVTYLVGHYRKKMKREFERGFTEDERKVLFILSKERRIMQKRIERELGFSRAKMTRIVLKLEKKGLVEKERVGRTNRLFYKK